MSYILDALKKSEQKRQRDRIPDLLTVQDAAIKKPKKRSLVILLFLAALFLTAGLLWWLSPYKPGETDMKIARSNDAAKTLAASIATAPAEVPKDTAPAAPQAQTITGIQKENSDVYLPAVNQLPAAQPSHSGKKSAAGQKAPGLNELPPSVRQAVSNITISGHFYDAKPSSRIVSINGRIAREGQNVTPTLKLEQITSDGVIFSYEGYRFFMGMF